MSIGPIVSQFSPSFGYSHKLKTLYKQGKLPTVTHGLYLQPLKPDSVSLEHIIPHSKGGPTVLWNLALADQKANALRSNKDIKQFLTEDMIKEYLDQFTDVVVDGFKGNKYKELLTKTFTKLGFKL